LARDLAQRAEAVLQANSAGAWTKPSPTQYPHQWNWDSGFISLGWAIFDLDRAMLEIESLLRGRWRDGMVPHLRYDPRHLGDYFPGPDWWPGAAARVASPGELTSGISNPPVVVIAALEVGRRASAEPRRRFYQLVYGPLRDFVLWFRDHRTLPGSPLPVMVHPWESGWDNSPRWDHLASAGLRPSRPYQRLDTVHVGAAERPTGKDYDSFLALAGLIDGAGYDIGRIRERSPFCIHDVLLDALWFRAARAVGEMAQELGQRPPIEAPELEEYRVAFEAAHWDEAAGAYFDVDVLTGRRISVPTAAGIASLAGGIADAQRARRAWEGYRTQTSGLRRVATAAPGEWFEPARYWRGPAWINVNWLCIEGLEAAGLAVDAAALRDETLGLCQVGDLHEYFDARSGAPLGSARFSWTAALTLDLLHRKGKPV
jgi:hypothetical protein